MASIRTNLLVFLFSLLQTSTAVEFAAVEQRQQQSASASPPTITHLPAQYFPELNSTHVKVSYGPYEVPASTQNGDGINSFLDRGATKPCSDCIVIWMRAGLEYDNGSYANANTSLWLHHTFLENTAHTDTVCGEGPRGERFFASGNERSIIDISRKGVDRTGYYISGNDTIAIYSELINALPTPQSAVVTIEYEYIPLPLANASFRHATPIWLDIAGCSTTGLPVRPHNASVWNYSSPTPWKSTISGRANWLTSHFLDGGVHLQTRRNGGIACDARATYGEPGFVNPLTGRPVPAAVADRSHVSAIEICEDVGQVEVGDEWSITAYYNTTEYAPLAAAAASGDSQPQQQPAAGIALMYVAEGEEVAAATSTASGASAATATGSGTASATSSSSGTGGMARWSSTGLILAIGMTFFY